MDDKFLDELAARAEAAHMGAYSEKYGGKHGGLNVYGTMYKTEQERTEKRIRRIKALYKTGRITEEETFRLICEEVPA